MPELTSPHPIGEHAPQQSDLPAPPRAHALTLENRARLTVTGVTRIVSCDELGATLQTPLGDLIIGGQGMQVSELSVRTGEVHISGQIEYLQYTENQQSKKTERWAAGPPAALMVPSPPLWAVLGDVLLCLGAGLLLGAVRDGATLAFGSGPVRCFVWDVLAFAAAAFVCCGFAAGASATGAARWYMAAAMGLGALCWRWCVSHAVHRALRGTVFVLVWPLRFAADYAVHPFKQRLLARIRKIRHARRHNAQDSCKKSGKKPKNVLQNKHTILYN